MPTEIQWCDETWNPVTGCTKVSAGCKNCYAEAVSRRWGKDFAKIELHPERLDMPLRWRKPRRVFVNSMSDLFHELVPTDFMDQVFARMALAQEHTFQVLTKRPEAMRRYLEMKDPCCLASAAPEQYPRSSAAIEDRLWPLPNVWLGVSIEDQASADERIPLLLQTPASVRFLSVEPLLEAVNVSKWVTPYLTPEEPRIDWVIVGGESGPGARPCNIEWIRSIIAQCKAAGVACFVKQLGTNPTGRVILPRELRRYGPNPLPYPIIRDRKGGDPAEWPTDLRVREYPQ